MTVYWIYDVCPQPWEVIAQSYKAGGRYCKARLRSPDQFVEFKDDLAASFDSMYPDVIPEKKGTLLSVSFAFWRNTTDGAELADSTNMQKATEDVMQGRLYDNDRENRFVSSEIIEQSKDCRNLIRIEVSPYVPTIYEIPPKPKLEARRVVHLSDVEFDFDL